MILHDPYEHLPELRLPQACLSHSMIIKLRNPYSSGLQIGSRVPWYHQRRFCEGSVFDKSPNLPEHMYSHCDVLKGLLSVPKVI